MVPRLWNRLPVQVWKADFLRTFKIRLINFLLVRDSGVAVIFLVTPTIIFRPGSSNYQNSI